MRRILKVMWRLQRLIHASNTKFLLVKTIEIEQKHGKKEVMCTEIRKTTKEELHNLSGEYNNYLCTRFRIKVSKKIVYPVGIYSCFIPILFLHIYVSLVQFKGLLYFIIYWVYTTCFWYYVVSCWGSVLSFWGPWTWIFA